ncbi:MAG: guanylate kinase [Clostridia bacterium]|nr:guanylate kinase [Clostridia bacterium]
MTRKGMLLVVSGPSGVGKGTLCEMLLKNDETFHFSVSATTRSPRLFEKDGVNYHFISEEEYDKLLAQDAFLEHATVHGKRYGTLKSEVRGRLEKGENVLLDIDPQGALNVMAKEPDCVSVYILPPSFDALRQRLTSRNTETKEDIKRRLANAQEEIETADRYQYNIINDDLETAFSHLLAIVTAEKHRTNRFFPTVPEE